MNEENRNDEVSLFEIFNVLRAYKWLLFGLPIAGAISAALFASLVLQPKWEGSATLEVGRVGGTVAEPVVNVVTRMMLPSFSRGVLNTGVFKPEEMEEAQASCSTLKAVQIKGADLIEVKLRAPSAEMAQKLIQGSILNLQKMQSEVMAVTIEKNKKQLQLLSDDVKQGSAELDLLKKKLLAAHDWNTFDATLAATMLKDKTLDLRKMVQDKLALEELLSSSRTYPAKVVDEIYVSKDPVSPNKLLIIGLAVLLGLFAAVVIAFAHHAFTKSAAR